MSPATTTTDPSHRPTAKVLWLLSRRLGSTRLTSHRNRRRDGLVPARRGHHQDRSALPQSYLTRHRPTQHPGQRSRQPASPRAHNDHQRAVRLGHRGEKLDGISPARVVPPFGGNAGKQVLHRPALRLQDVRGLPFPVAGVGVDRVVVKAHCMHDVKGRVQLPG